MAFRDLPELEQGAQWLQRSLARGRLGHAYLFTGDHSGELEAAARTLAKTLNCLQPVRGPLGPAIDCCDKCLNCRRIDHENHPDVHWVRPESKSRVIILPQMRALMRAINLKPTEAEYKVSVIVGADRLNVQSGNAFLKTLEEPPANSILILLTTEPQRLLETILSRCLRLSFAGEGARRVDPAAMNWLAEFSQTAAGERKSLLGRYQLLDTLLRKLSQLKETIEQTLTARSPAGRYPDTEKELLDKWEAELAASIEAEYRRQRSELLLLVERWLRDVCVLAVTASPGKENGPAAGPGREAISNLKPPATDAGTQTLLSFPQLPATQRLARRISPGDCIENLRTFEQLQSWLGTNVQEALALEVALLKLHL